jgi:hypothetical protein
MGAVVEDMIGLPLFLLLYSTDLRKVNLIYGSTVVIVFVSLMICCRRDDGSMSMSINLCPLIGSLTRYSPSTVSYRGFYNSLLAVSKKIFAIASNGIFRLLWKLRRMKDRQTCSRLNSFHSMTDSLDCSTKAGCSICCRYSSLNTRYSQHSNALVRFHRFCHFLGSHYRMELHSRGVSISILSYGLLR